tara:strand:- start:70 stop:231 length:162 start_codon:yes stop_codon:yes gene_type:complete
MIGIDQVGHIIVILLIVVLGSAISSLKEHEELTKAAIAERVELTDAANCRSNN